MVLERDLGVKSYSQPPGCLLVEWDSVGANLHCCRRGRLLSSETAASVLPCSKDASVLMGAGERHGRWRTKDSAAPHRAALSFRATLADTNRKRRTLGVRIVAAMNIFAASSSTGFVPAAPRRPPTTPPGPRHLPPLVWTWLSPLRHWTRPAVRAARSTRWWARAPAADHRALRGPEMPACASCATRSLRGRRVGGPFAFSKLLGLEEAGWVGEVEEVEHGSGK